MESPNIDPCLWLDRLAAVFRSCSLPTKEDQATTHPYMEVIAEIWPIIKSVCLLFQTDVIVIERSTRCAHVFGIHSAHYHHIRCIRFMLRSVGVAAVAILQDVVEMVFILVLMLPVCYLLMQSMQVYQHWKHSCFLYLGSIIVDEFGLVSSCQSGLVTMVHVSH